MPITMGGGIPLDALMENLLPTGSDVALSNGVPLSATGREEHLIVYIEI